MDEKAYKRLLNKAAAYCAKAEKSPKEVTDKLSRWSEEPLDIETEQRIMDFLIREKFVDEERYATKYINDKIDLLHKGPLILSQELSHKGISPSVIRQKLEEITDDEWLNAATSYLKPKLEGYRRKSRNPYDLRMRLSRAAYGRGFPSSLIDKALSTFDLATEDNEEYYD